MDIATDRADDVAVVSPRGTRVTYGTLLAHADALADSMRATFARIADEGDGDDGVMTHEPPPEDVLKGERVAISAVPGPEYAAAMQATWMCGAIAVPIARGHTKAEMAHVLRDSGAALFAHVPEHLTDEEHADGRDAMDAFEFVESVGIQRMVTVPRVDERTSMDGIMRRKKTANPMGRERNASSDGALIIYTSGTTGAPKGVLHTHGSLAAQCTALMNAWEWSRYDRMYHVLPLHHIHGIVNGWMCAAAAGATVEFAGDASFAPRAAWSRLRDVDLPPVTIFMGVPTMYVMMLRAFEGAKRRNRGDIFRKPTKFKAIDSAVPTKRNALVDLGPVVQKSRAMLVCLGGSLESQLAAARAGVHAACREASELEVARVRGAFFDLQMQYRQLHEQSQAQIARLSHLEAVAKHIVTFCVVGGHYHFAHVARPCSSTRGSDGPV